jgi:hypothetical protein
MKVLLVHSGASPDELKQIRLWLEAVECQIDVFDLFQRHNDDQTKSLVQFVTECEAVVFLADQNLPIDEMQIAVLAANARGKKIISVRLSGKALPDAFEKYGSASVGFVRSLIVGAVRDDSYVWIDEDGESREEPETERHKCKKKKPKNAAA